MNPDRQIKLIFNPAANHLQAGQAVADLQAQFDEHTSISWVATEYPGHATKLAAEAALEGVDTVVAVGGDGTVNEVVNGLMRIAAEHRPSFGVVPVGSGNDFAGGVGISLDPTEAMQAILKHRPAAIDIGRISDEHGRRHYWSNACGIGLDAIINIRSRQITFVHGFLMYLLATLRTVFGRYSTPPVEMQLDDGPVVRRHILMMTLGNGPREGGGFQTTPDAVHGDGLLDYCMVNQIGRLTILLLLPQVMQGTHGRSRHVTLGRFRRLSMKADGPLTVHLDGEVFASAEANARNLTVEVLPQALNVYI